MDVQGISIVFRIKIFYLYILWMYIEIATTYAQLIFLSAKNINIFTLSWVFKILALKFTNLLQYLLDFWGVGFEELSRFRLSTRPCEKIGFLKGSIFKKKGS